LDPEAVAMRAMQWIFLNHKRLKLAQRMGRIAQRPFIRASGWIEWLPGMLGGWTQTRDLQPLPQQSFREWFEKRAASGGNHG
jgi:L-lactate dehydrogenase complex protein LldF